MIYYEIVRPRKARNTRKSVEMKKGIKTKTDQDKPLNFKTNNLSFSSVYSVVD
jgi:hypothetical protein